MGINNKEFKKKYRFHIGKKADIGAYIDVEAGTRETAVIVAEEVLKEILRSLYWIERVEELE